MPIFSILSLALCTAACGSTEAPPAAIAPCPETAPAARSAAPVGPRTPQHLRQVFARSPDLPPLSAEAVNEILDSATWSYKGLSSFSAVRASSELSPAQFEQLLLVMALPPEGVIPDAWCSSHATCTKRIGSWCVVANC